MTEETSAQNGVAKLPSIAPRIITTVLIICAAILLGEWLQDQFRKTELLETQRINLYQQQSTSAFQIMNSILQFKTASTWNDNFKDDLKIAINDLRSAHDSLALLEKNEMLAESDLYLEQKLHITQEFKQIIRDSNEVLALIEIGDVYNSRIEMLYELLVNTSKHFYADINFMLRKFTINLQHEVDNNRTMAWWITAATILFVFLIGLSRYFREKRIIFKQFNLINETNTELKDEIVLRKNIEEKITRQTEENLAEQRKFKSILNSTEDAIITMTTEGRIDYFNKAAETMFGYSADGILGKDIKIILPEKNHARHDEMLKKYQETGELEILGHGRETISKHVDQTEFPSKQFVSKISYKGSDLFVGVIQDITKRKKAEDKLHETLAELTQKQTELEEEERIARHVFENITASNNDIIPEVSSWCEPMGTFSGDMMLSAILPSGGIRIILCDFTGHGLPAALGAVPVSTIHSAMAKKGLPLEILMNELNNKLNELLPTGIFCCIAGIDLDAERTHAQIWNAGLPEVLVVNQTGEITQRIVSNHLPLGVVSYNKNELHCREIQLGAGDSIYALSDGLTEAESEAGDMFGQQRFEQLLMNETDEHGRLTDIRNSIGKFVGQAAPTDDVSLIEIKTLVTTD